MALPNPGAIQVGSYFVGQYYQVLQQHPELVYQFYSDNSSMIRVDGDSTESASAILQIHSMVLSLEFTAIEIKTINSLDSWNRGIIVMVTGSAKTKAFSNRREFVQIFFLAPQEKGYFILNDIFQFIEKGSDYQLLPRQLSENAYDAPLDVSNQLPEQQVSDYDLEDEAVEYVNSVHIDDDPVDKYSLQEQAQHQQDFEDEVVVEETPIEEASATHFVNHVPEPPVTAVEEPAGESVKMTYASILRVAKEPSAPAVATQQSFNKSTVTTSEWDYNPVSDTQQPSSAPSYAPAPQQPSYTPTYAPESGYDMTEDGSAFEEGEFKSVYVRNLPSTITAEEIEDEFQNFGRIKPDGVFIRNRKDVVGVCYAFVEFEDMVAVQNAIKSSPIQLAGRNVYIEERRPNTTGIRGGRRGRGGRGSYPTEAPRGGRFGSRGGLGRGNSQDGSDYRQRGNGFHPRGSR